jgi:lipid A 3-O-deacylase
MRSSAVWVLGILLAVSAAAPLAGAPSPWRLGPPESVVASSGVFDPLVDGDGEGYRYEVGAEVRFAPRRFHFLPKFLPELAPTAGVIAGSQGALYVYGGLHVDVPLGERWTFSPSWAAGLYHRSVSFDLGGPLEFRTGVELAYRMANGARLGVCLYHLSNGGLFERNPGSESLVLTYSAGLRRSR